MCTLQIWQILYWNASWCQHNGWIPILFNFNLGWMNRYFINISMYVHNIPSSFLVISGLNRYFINIAMYVHNIPSSFLVISGLVKSRAKWIYFLKQYGAKNFMINLFTVIQDHESRILVKITYLVHFIM